MAIANINGASMANIARIDGATAGSIAKINGAEKGAGVVAPTIAVVSGDDNRTMISTTEGFASGSWTKYQSNGRSADEQRSIAFGRQPDGADTWVICQNKTGRPIRVAAVTPTGSGDWIEVNPTGEAAYDIVHGYSGSTDPASGIAAFTVVGNDAEYASYYGDSGESITTGGDWVGRRPINSDLSTGKFLSGVGFNYDIENPLFVAVSNTGRVFSSTTGGDGDAADWTTRYGTTGTSGANHSESRALWEVAYNGVDKWVAVGYYDRMEHITGSGDATTWGVMNLPTGDPTRQMYGVDGDGDNWVVCGSSGYVWHSTDNAVTWTENQVSNADGGTSTKWQCVRYDGAGTWWLVGGSGYLAKSSDMVNWTHFRTPMVDEGGNSAYSIAFNKIRTSS